ncbi:MAG: flippase [Trichodesmium sp.]
MLNKLVTITQKFSPDIRQIISNTTWLFLDRIIQMGLSLFVGIWVARYLGPEQYGILNYSISFVALFLPLVTMGLDGIIVRELVRNQVHKNTILGTSFALKLIGGVLTLLLTTSIIYFLKPGETETRTLIGIIALGTIFQSFETIDFWFRSQTQSKYTVLAKNTVYIIVSVARIASVQAAAPLIAFAWIKSIEIVLNAIGLLIVYQIRGECIIRWSANLEQAKRFLKDSWPLILAGISTYIYASIDQVMLGQMSTVKSLGIYSVAVKLSEIFNFLPVLLSQSILPSVVKKSQEGEDILLETMQTIYDIMAVIWFFTALVVSIFSASIISIVYGDAYSDSAIVLSIYIWSQFGSNFGVARSIYINVKNLFKLSLIISFVGAITNIILNAWLIPKYEAIGATIATLITYFVAVILMNLFLRDLRKLIPIIFKSLLIPRSLFRILNLVKFKSI